MSVNQLTNIERATAAWGVDMPAWVRLLAGACDRTSQMAVADKLQKSSGYVSRLINCKYAGSYDEAEKLVRAAFAADRIACPAFNSTITHRLCLRDRRRDHRRASNTYQRLLARACPTCPNNTDLPGDA